MIGVLARILGLHLLGRWVERLPPPVAAAARVLIVVIAFGVMPGVALSQGWLNPITMWWWLWLEVAVSSLWLNLIGVRRQVPINLRILWPLQFFGLFVVAPLIVGLFITSRLGQAPHPWLLVAAGVTSFVLQGWATRTQWWQPSPMPLAQANRLAWPTYVRGLVCYVSAYALFNQTGSSAQDDLVSLPELLLMMVVAKFVTELGLACWSLWSHRPSQRTQ